MAENDNYIGIAMGLDVSELKAGLKETSMRIKEANAEFKEATSGMDNWQQSVEGVRAKTRQLTSVLDSQRRSLQGMEAEYARLVNTQGENSDSARRLMLRIQGQRAAINSTERELNNYRQTLADAEAGNIDLTQVVLSNGRALEQQGDSAEASSTKLSGLKKAGGVAAAGIGIVVGAVGGLMGGFLGLAESTREYREDMAKLNSAFEGAGLTTESAKNTYKELFSVIGESDTAVEASQQIALLARSEEEAAKWATLATGVTATFGDALKPEAFYEAANETLNLNEATGAFTQMLEQTGMSVDDFNAGLAACTTESEKQAYMLSVSEKAMGKAGEAYRETNKDVLDAQKAQSELTDALAELGAIAEPIMTSLKYLAADLLTSITPFVELIGTGLRGALEGTAGASETLAEGLGGVLNALVERITNILPTVLNVLLELIPNIANTLLSALPQLLDVVIELTNQIVVMLGEVLPQIVSKIIEIVPLLVHSLATAIPELVSAAVNFLLAIVQAIPVLIDQLLLTLPNIVQAILNSIITAFPLLMDGAIQLFNAIIDAIPIIIESLLNVLPDIISAIVNFVVDSVPILLEAAVELLMAIIDSIPIIMNLLQREIPVIVTTIIATLLKNLPLLIKAAIQLLSGILEAIPFIVIELVKQAPSIVTSLAEGLIDSIPILIDAGIEMVKGIWEGIKNADNWLKKKISSFAGNVADWFKDAFQIDSPSKLLEDEIGVDVGRGVIPTRPNALREVKKSINKFTDYVSDNLGNIKAGLTVDTQSALAGANSSFVGNGGGRNTTITAPLTINYNGRLSQKEIKRQEDSHYRSIKSRMKMEGLI